MISPPPAWTAFDNRHMFQGLHGLVTIFDGIIYIGNRNYFIPIFVANLLLLLTFISLKAYMVCRIYLHISLHHQLNP